MAADPCRRRRRRTLTGRVALAAADVLQAAKLLVQLDNHPLLGGVLAVVAQVDGAQRVARQRRLERAQHSDANLRARARSRGVSEGSDGGDGTTTT